MLASPHLRGRLLRVTSASALSKYVIPIAGFLSSPACDIELIGSQDCACTSPPNLFTCMEFLQCLVRVTYIAVRTPRSPAL